VLRILDDDGEEKPLLLSFPISETCLRTLLIRLQGTYLRISHNSEISQQNGWHDRDYAGRRSGQLSAPNNNDKNENTRERLRNADIKAMVLAR
jgi:hypothetical protein